MDNAMKMDSAETLTPAETLEGITRDIMQRGGISEGAAYAAALQIIELRATRAMIERDLKKLNL
jgi:hypothetical protein